MVPTYFRRELRDRVFQRRRGLALYLICVVFDLCCRRPSFAESPSSPSRHTPRKRGILYAAASRFDRECSGILDRPLSRTMTTEQEVACLILLRLLRKP